MLQSIRIECEYLPCEKVEINFDNTNNAIIFGRNGSGKSTISRAIEKFSETQLKNTKEKENNEIEDNNEDEDFKQPFNISFEYNTESNKVLDNIYVYNDDFQKDHVTFSDSGNFESIVMLGEQGNIQDTIDSLNRVLKEIEGDIELKEEEINSFNLDLKVKEIKDMLKGGNSSWAYRQKVIDNLTTNKPLTNKLFEKIIKKHCTEDYYDIKESLDENIDLIRNILQKKPLEYYRWVSFPHELFRKIEEILKYNPEVSKLTQKEEVIVKTIIKYGNEKIDFADSIAKDKNQEYCPTCFRPLGDSDKNEIRRLIKEVLEKNNTETLENRIEYVLSEIKEQELIKIDDRVDVKTQSDLNKNIGIFNYYVKKTVEILEEKRRYPYKTKFEGYCVNDLKKTLDKLKEKIEIYEQLVITYNSSFKELSIIQDKATELNIKLASIEIKDKLTEYKEKENLYNNLCVENKNLINEKEIVENRIDKNIQELKKTNFALKEINDNLKLIFYDDNRLELVNQNNKYYIKSRGKYVKSNELSLGEQNVISLCYFFSTINKDRSIEDVYRHEMLLVLDDPISSFDYENKIGIYNFLRMKLKRVCRNNEDSKIIITTHDMEVLNNLEKLVSELKVVGKKNKTNLCLLNSNGVQPMKNKFKDQYKNQLRDIYSFAKGENDIVEQYIGNEMRKVLEAFSTFNFQCGMDDLRRSDNGFPLSIIKDDREKEFFESFMFRLVLNNESHSKDTVNNYTDQNFYQYLTLEEKVYTAKMQIVFMYKLNPYHIAKTIGESFSEKDIKKWSELIK